MTKICIIAGNKNEADTWARGQNLEPDQYFYPNDFRDLQFKSNFHVIIVGSVGQNLPSYMFERVYSLALRRGRIGRM